MDLAEDMIRFSGLEPDRDIAIEIIGRRHGEKLHEQLFNAYERPEPTPAQKIMRAARPARRSGVGGVRVRQDRAARRRGRRRRPRRRRGGACRWSYGCRRSIRGVAGATGLLDFLLGSMVLLAFSLQDQVEKYGAYVGIAAFFGLAVLTLLYFAQAREVKRLREWAGRAPERAAELEKAVAEHAEEVRRVTPVPQPQVVAQPQLQRVGRGRRDQRRRQAQAGGGRRAGLRARRGRARAARAASAARSGRRRRRRRAADAGRRGRCRGRDRRARRRPGAERRRAAAVPAPATPAARRADPPARRSPPRRTAAPPRRAPAPPPRRESNTRAVVLTAVIGVLVLAACVFVLTQVIGGDDPTTPAPAEQGRDADAGRRVLRGADQDRDAGADQGRRCWSRSTTAPRTTGPRGQTSATCSSPTAIPKDNLGTDTAPPEQQRQTSVVMYRRGAKAAAEQVADALGITDGQAARRRDADADRQRADSGGTWS